jgi:hypothetical protein
MDTHGESDARPDTQQNRQASERNDTSRARMAPAALPWWQLLVLALVAIVLFVLLIKLALPRRADVDPLLLAAVVLLTITLVVSATVLARTRSLMDVDRRLDGLDERVLHLERRETGS